MKTSRSQWIRGVAAGLLALAFGAGAFAQGAYPNRPIKLIVPWTTAGTVDISARMLAERLSAKLGQPVVVDNRAGATGQIGSQAVARSPADGYTLLVMSATVHSVSPNIQKTFPFDPIDDFTPVSEIVRFPYALVVSSNSPYQSVADLVAAAKKAPGTISYGSFGPASAPYLITEMLALASGTKLLHVPYKGAAPAITDVMAGHIHFFIDSLPSPLSQVRGGKLRALAVTTSQRSTVLPNVPTLAETLPGFEAIAWLGIAAPPQTPRDVVAKLHAALQQIAAEPEYGAKLRDIGLEPTASASPEQFRTFLQGQKAHWAKVIKDANIPLSD
ncbi:Bug family tripartite tricarboxylate transporter substrate binding protein [Ramlibacter albus]|uniref:Tripartite tricarboxylate transporter substrate binding protein n=1 Tax=Ramlibacter albus TaxID=2079448 RepID=A0A923MD79_9BURK|nr:tripartite tricarboxylate transporter substrate binding protein [Ramlibacter albus]MBC5767860.1 tripartite tricarboxylate transporter substrate binding protein [Ramlibacter albus]